MTSYENKLFKSDGLIQKLVEQLITEGYTYEDITLISQYPADLDRAAQLSIKNMRPEEFFRVNLIEPVAQIETSSSSMRSGTYEPQNQEGDCVSTDIQQKTYKLWETGARKTSTSQKRL